MISKFGSLSRKDVERKVPVSGTLKKIYIINLCLTERRAEILSSGEKDKIYVASLSLLPTCWKLHLWRARNSSKMLVVSFSSPALFPLRNVVSFVTSIQFTPVPDRSGKSKKGCETINSYLRPLSLATDIIINKSITG